MAIKVIIFDCFGVLVQPGKTILYKKFPNLKNDIDNIEHQWHYGLISRQQFNEQMAELIGISPDDVKSKYYDISVRDESAIDWVRQVKLSGDYKVGLLSNVGSNRINDFFQSSEQSELFDDMVLSFDVGMIKPEIMIYELAAKRFGVEMNECIMIDDISLNVEAANNAGMHGLLYVSVEQARADVESIIESFNA